MSFKNLFRRKTIETLLAEMAGEHQLHRALGPIALTALGVGAIIGAGIFVMTGRAAATIAGPGIVVSYVVAAVGCTMAALCYSEFAAMAPVAGSAYTYAYATLGELFAWIIGWDLMLEYAMSCATVAAAWSHYLNALLGSLGLPEIPAYLISDPYTYGGWSFNLPGVLIMLVITAILVRGIRESATTNAILVLVKVGVVLFVIAVGAYYVNPSNWTGVPVDRRVMPHEGFIPTVAKEFVAEDDGLTEAEANARVAELEAFTTAQYKLHLATSVNESSVNLQELTRAEADQRIEAARQNVAASLPQTDADKAAVEEILQRVDQKATAQWGMLGNLGLNKRLAKIDDSTRTRFFPYGFSGVMLGASIVFFAYIGFDSISTHAEEAKNPQRDVPLAILGSLALCTVLYIAVSAVITGMVPYPDIDRNAAIANAFGTLAEERNSVVLRGARGLIAAGGLAGMTSVLLVTLLSQVRVFMAMARDGLLPKMFGEVHPRFRTPHLATMLTSGVICIACAFTPIDKLTEMVNIGTLMAFVVVCAAVMMLRIQSPEIHRPFRCPLLYVVAPLGILVNVIMMLFLPWDTWLRLVGWLAAGLAIYLFYSRFHSKLSTHTMHEIKSQGISPTDAPLNP